MKIIYTLIIGLFVVTSCTSSGEKDASQNTEIDSTAQNVNDENDIQNLISQQWVLVNRKSLKKDTTVNFSPTPPSIITEFKISGYFSISDLIDISSDQGKTQKLEKRISGQWDLTDDLLVMRFGTGDTTNVEKYHIEKLDDETLVLKNAEENVISTYSKRK